MPTPKLSAIGLLSIGGETTFGTEAGTLVPMRCYPVDLSGLTAEAIMDEHQRQGDYGVKRIVGPHVGSITTKHNMHGWTSTPPEDVPARLEATNGLATAHDQLLAVMASAFGNIHTNGYLGATPTSGGSTSLNASSLATFAIGGPVVWGTQIARRPYELGWFQDIDLTATPDAGTLLTAFTYSPVSSDAIWGGHTVFVRDGDPYHDSGAKSWTLQFQGHASDYCVKCFGCRPTNVKIVVEAGKVPTLEITWGVAHWTSDNTGGAPNVLAWDFPQPQAVSAWRVAINGAEQVVRSFEFDLGLQRAPIAGGAGASGIEGWFTASRKPTVKLQVFRDHATEITAFEDQNAVIFEAQWGSQPGKMFGLCLPAAHLIEYPKASDRDGAVVSELVLEGHRYAGDDTATLTIPANTPARLVFA